MSRITLIDLELESTANKKKYIEDIWIYLIKIRDICRRHDPTCRAIVFGSFVKKNMRCDSDIDVLLITRYAEDPIYRGKIFRDITKEIGFDNPFEIHIATEKEYIELYRKFIDVYQEIG